MNSVTENNKPMWYIVQVYSGFEKSVIEHIKNMANLEGYADSFIELYYPFIEEDAIVGGEVKKKQRSLYPGYIFTNILLSQKVWEIISNVPRVIGFVGSDRLAPKPMTELEYQKMLKDVSEPISIIEEVDFSFGDVVRIKSGSFESLNGTVSGVDRERKMVTILLLIFDRETTLDLEWSQIEKVDK
ncbi:MAG: transcription termination/antitermination factor NusG [Alphaproteobacteria bacterium]|nr:transcription termination/antitermination factor NusG [Rickettsiales bacterium]